MKVALSLKEGQERGKVEWIFLIPAILAIIIAAVTPMVLTSLTLGRLHSSTTIDSSGTVKAVGVRVYWDNNCTDQVSSINWEIVEPGSVNNETVYIRNESNAPVTLSLATENWNPTNASDYMSLSWDYGGQEIGVDEVDPVTLSLSVSSNITGITNFSFDIIITGTSL